MHKPKLTKEQADILEYVKRIGLTERVIGSIAGKKMDLETYLIPLEKLDLQDLMAALVNGYEIEESPEDYILSLYKEFLKIKYSGNMNQYQAGFLQALAIVIDTIGIETKDIDKNYEWNLM